MWKRKLVESYEGIHVESRRGLDTDYDCLYENYEVKVKSMTDWIKKAKKQIRAMKEEKVEKD